MLSWLWSLAAAYGWILLFCLFCGLVGVACWPLMIALERLEDRYGVDDDAL